MNTVYSPTPPLLLFQCKKHIRRDAAFTPPAFIIGFSIFTPQQHKLSVKTKTTKKKSLIYIQYTHTRIYFSIYKYTHTK